MTTNKLFIGNLNRQVRRQELKDFFGQRGEVAFASVSMDRETNRSRGFGFVTFVEEVDAIKAKEEATGQMLQDRELFIDYARPKPGTEESENETPKGDEAEEASQDQETLTEENTEE